LFKSGIFNRPYACYRRDGAGLKPLGG